MLSYEFLDRIADTINPVLALTTLAVPWVLPLRRRTHPMAFLAGAALAIAAVYGLQALDQATGLWPTLTLNYSTHTAFAAALVTSLGFLERRLLWLFVPVFLGYVALMLYQRYHSLSEIVTTTIVIVPCSLLAHWAVRRIWRGGTAR
jgi:hypothetical protein